MGSFKDPLILEDVGDGTFIVRKSFSYSLGEIGSNIIITVPENFRTDLASIPSICNIIVPKLGKYNKGAVIHDYLYSLCRLGKFDRTISDAVFYEIMKVCGVRLTQRVLIYVILRLFGWIAIKFSRSLTVAVQEMNKLNGKI